MSPIIFGQKLKKYFFGLSIQFFVQILGSYFKTMFRLSPLIWYNVKYKLKVKECYTYYKSSSPVMSIINLIKHFLK